ncbi:hypothetical protein F5Y14DRAFT_465138 [Nemania sp. NC0429]|nr:hypothetical protein F5Y14DRAFT_465138 [Nemania sp. NC0429]
MARDPVYSRIYESADPADSDIERPLGRRTYGKYIYSRDLITLHYRNWLIYGLLAFLSPLAFILGSILHPFSLYNLNTDSPAHSRPEPRSPESFIPLFSFEIKTFRYDPAFADDPSEKVDEAWLSLIPKGQGVISLPGVSEKFNSSTYNIAAYHNLHCLYMLRKSLFYFHEMSITPGSLDLQQAPEMLKHGRHCIEYIRHVFLCDPELTLFPVTENPRRLRKWNLERQCTNFRELSDWARVMRSGDVEGIV